MGVLSVLKKLVLDFLFPPVCASCRKEGDYLCADCLGSLAKRKISPKTKKPDAEPEFQYLDGVIYALDYAKNPQIKAAIQQFKYKFTEELAAPFASLIAEKIGELGMVKNRRIVLIPIPLHAKRLAYRGFNQAEVLARAIQARWPEGLCEVQNRLVRQKETSQQAKLDRAGRLGNLEGAFQINKLFCHPERLRANKVSREGVEWMNKKFIHSSSSPRPCSGKAPEMERGSENLYFLVDDVCTTGSTLENAAKVLSENGFGKVYGLVIARQNRVGLARAFK